MIPENKSPMQTQTARTADHAQRLISGYLRKIDPILRDPTVTEVMINNPFSVWAFKAGVMVNTGITIDLVELNSALKAISTLNGKEFSPVFDSRLPGFRIAAAQDPVSINGTSLCIRKHASKAFSLDDYVTNGSFELAEESDASVVATPAPYEALKRGGEGLKAFIDWAVKNSKNIAVAGATDSGKTTLMRAIISAIPDDERIITIEDTSELGIKHPNFVSFETNEEKKIDYRRLIRLSLRYRPDRIVIGEIRGAEAYDALDAMNTGHGGGCFSLHADSAVQALYRLEDMVQKAPETINLPLVPLRKKIASVVNYVIFNSNKFGPRSPEEIIEVQGVNESGDYVTKSIFNKQKGVL